MTEGTREPGPSSPQILVSICIPAYDRPHLLERALHSVTSDSASEDEPHRIQIVVSDASRDSESGEVSRRALARWPGPSCYSHNKDRLGLVGNFNQCVLLARGRFVLILHDDDYLLPGAGGALVQAVTEFGDRDRVLLFGVKVVNSDGRILRRQGFPSQRYLPPRAAVRRALSESSFVRFPAIVVRRDAYSDVGLFDPDLGNPTDLDMWIRLFSQFGVNCMPQTTCAYYVHDEAATSAMFDAATVDTIMRIFDRAAADGVLPERDVRRSQTRWFHQFILGGAVRQLRNSDTAAAARILALFQLQEVRALGWSGRWLAVRLAVSGLVRLPSPLGARVARGVGRMATWRP
jgi:glycosyltransferase involved in cell wall biosynthesis